MNTTKIRQMFALANVVAAILILLWWICMGVLLPVNEAAESFDVMITHPNWVPVNIAGFVACLFWALSIPGIYMHLNESNRKIGFIGLIIAEIGVVMFACIQYYETFLWPVVVRYNPELLMMDGPLVFGDRLILVPLIISGVILGLGYIMLGIDLLSRRTFPKMAVIMLMFGALAFGNGLVFPIRTLGLLILSTAMTWIGIHLVRLTGNT